jgi:predicted proteasome-type protease
MPFDIAVYPEDRLVAPLRQEVTMESGCYTSFQVQWQAGLCQTFERLPSMVWPSAT